MTIDSANTTAVDDTRLDPHNPWPGLLTFREEDAQFFHGRKRETEQLFRLVMRARLTVLFGVSGLGKSSLLHAGLFPGLRPQQILPVYLRPDLSAEQPKLIEQVCEAIAAAAAAAGVEAPARQPDDTLWEYLHRRDADFWSPRNRVVYPLLVFDQFEELFTLGRSSPERTAASAALIDELVDLVEGRPPARLKERLDRHPDEASAFDFINHNYKLIFSLREDFLPDLESIRQQTGAVVLNRMRLECMTGVAAMEVVNQPHLIEPHVAERVVRSVSAVEDESRPLESLTIEPALLSVVCRELNLKRQLHGDALITMELVAANEKQIVSGLYERGMAGLAPEVRIFVEEQLLTASGYRDSVAVENVLGQPGITAADLKRLVDGRLVRIDTRGELNRLELTHDLLAGVIVASRDKRRQQEATAEELRARLAAEEREQQVRRKLRRSQAIGLGFLLLALFAAGVAVFAFQKRSAAIAAKDEAQEALANLYVASAVRLIDTDRSDEALAYLGQALRIYPASLAARSWLSDLLLRKRWILPSSPELQHEGHVTVATFDRAGGRIVTASQDHTARIWDAASGKPLGPALLQDGAINSVAISPDQQQLATAAANGTVQLWDMATGAALDVAMKHGNDPVNWVAFSADQKWLVTASDDNTARLWDAADGSPVQEWTHPERVIMAVFGAGGQVLTASLDDTARVWDPSSDSAVATLRHDGPVKSVAFSTDGGYAATASDDGTARVWDTATWQPLMIKPLRHPEPVDSVAFAPDGGRLATASADNTARVWNTSTGDPIGDPMQHSEEVYSAVFSKDGRRIVTASRDGTARLWNAWTGVPLGEPMRHDDRVSVAAFNADGSQVVTASWDGTARAWKVVAGVAVGEPYAHEKKVIDAAFSADGKRLLTVPDEDAACLYDVASATLAGKLRPEDIITSAASSADEKRLSTVPDQNAARLCDVDSAALVGELRHDKKITSAAFSPDGQYIVTTSLDKKARIWDAGTGDTVGAAMTHNDPVLSAVFSPDGTRIATASGDETRLWNAATGIAASEMKHEKTVHAVAFSPDGTRIVTASQDEKARIWDARTGTPIGAPLPHEGPVVAVAFSPDGDKVVTGANSGAKSGFAQIWNADTGVTVGEPVLHKGKLSHVSFSPDGGQILTGSWDGTAQLSDATTGAPIGAPLRHCDKVIGATKELPKCYRVTSARYSPDGSRVATASRDNTARIWDAQTGAPVGEPMRHGGDVNSAAFTPDGRRLVTASSRGMVRVLDVLLGSDDNAELLAELAESVGGYEISSLGTLSILSDQKQRLAQLADKVANAPGDASSAASLVRWMFADADGRSISPLSAITVADYLDRRLDPSVAPAFCQLGREFPDHPLLVAWPPCKIP